MTEENHTVPANDDQHRDYQHGDEQHGDEQHGDEQHSDEQHSDVRSALDAIEADLDEAYNTLARLA